jgi:hypothetical protein
VAGHHSLRYDTGPEAALEEAKLRMAEVIAADCKRDIGGDVQQLHQVDTRYSDVTFKLVLLPVWIGSYLYGGKPYQVLINGVTGEVQGDRPYSTVKIIVAVLVAVALTALVLWLTTMR